MVKKAEVKKCDYKIVAKKFLKKGLLVFLAGIAAIYAENPYYLAFAPIVEAIENVLKHGGSFKDIFSLFK